MPRKRRTNKRKKKQPKIWSPPKDWTLHLWVLFSINFLAGLFFSQITSATTVRVVGAPPFERQRIEKLAQALDDRPYFLVDKEQVRSMAMEARAVKKARYQANLFGRGVLSLEYHRPVARIGDAFYLADGGAVFSWPLGIDKTMAVEPPDQPGGRNLAVFGSWESGTIARMCENIGERLPDMDWRLVVARDGSLSLEPAEGGTVEFGSVDEIDRKIDTLASILRDDPEVLSGVKQLNLISTVPTVIK